MASGSSKSGKGGKKYGRNSSFCTHYANINRRMKNKIRKVKRHAKKFPADKKAINWLKANT